MKNITKAIFLSASLALYLSCVGVGLNIIAQVEDKNGYGNLGSVTSFLIFFFSSIGNIVSTTYIQRYKFNQLFFLHGMGYLFFLSEGVLVCYCGTNKSLNQIFCSKGLIWFLVVVGSSVTGFLQAGFWVTHIQYTSQLCTETNKGLIFGITSALISSSLLIGPLVSSLIIQSLGQFRFFITILGVASLASLLFLMVQQPTQKHRQNNKISIQSNQKDYLTNSESTLTDDSQEFHNSPIMVQLKGIKEVFVSEKLRYLILPFIKSGVSISFQQTFLHILIQGSIDNTQSIELVVSLTLRVRLALGVAGIFGGIMTWQLSNQMGKSKILLLLNQFLQMALVVSLVNVYLKNYSVCFIVAGLFGIVDSGNSSTGLALISEEFNDIRVYGVCSFLLCCGGCIGSISSIIFSHMSPIYSLMFFQGFQALSNLCLHAWTRKYKG